MTPDKNAPMAVFLSSDAAKDVTGQVFGTRMNEIFLFSSPRPIRIVHRADGWTPESIAEHAAPALKAASCRWIARAKCSTGTRCSTSVCCTLVRWVSLRATHPTRYRPPSAEAVAHLARVFL